MTLGALNEPTAFLPFDEWQSRALQHRTRAEAWTVPFRTRRARREMHPVFDFLFIYYRCPPAQLEAWHPGIGVSLNVAPMADEEMFSSKYYSTADTRVFLDSGKLDAKQRNRLAWTRALCESVQKRPAQFGCFGLHEWAMVYRGGPDGRARHEGTLPFRLPQAEIDAVIESRPIICSHFDAFRFFTESAMPFNKLVPTHDSRMNHEQSGCLHANMDLYKWAAKSMPWIGSELLWETFEFAVKCRELDMRASPYDCRSLGYAPICIETDHGRAEYEAAQRALTEEARPLRRRLISALDALLGAP